MSLPNGEDDHNGFDDLAHLGHEGQHQPEHHQYETRQAAAAAMTPTQTNKDQEAPGVAQQTGRPAKAGKTTNGAIGADATPAVGADATPATDRAAATHPEMPATDQVMHMDFSNVPSGPYGIDPRTKKPYSAR